MPQFCWFAWILFSFQFSHFVEICSYWKNQATRYASLHYSVPVPSQDKLGGLWQKSHLAKNRRWWRWVPDSLDGLASRRIVGASAFVIFPGSIKSRSWQAIMEEIEKWCREFILSNSRYCYHVVHSRLKLLAVNLSWWSGWLWLYAGLIGSALSGS